MRSPTAGLSTTLQVFGPLGFLPFLSPSTLVAVILPLVANGLSTFWYQHSIEHHYGSLVIPALLMAAVFGVARAPARLRKALVVFMLLTAVIGLYLWGPAPASRNPGPWYRYPAEHLHALDDAIELIPKEAAVAADFRFVSR